MHIKYYFRYPHFLWAKEIYNIIKKYKLYEHPYFFDAPSGDGVISFWLNKWIKKGKFHLIDSSESSIKIASKNNKDFKVQKGNIFDYEENTKKEYTWLFINSLFCLNNGEKLINHFKNHAKHIICIFPDIDHKNYSCHYERYHFKNPNPLNEIDTLKTFQKYGYKILTKKKLTHIPFHCYSFKGQNIFFTFFDRFVFRKKGAYFICLFSRNK